MAVKLRLTRVGSRNNPIWRVVAADTRAPRDGHFLEVLGHYNPQTNPSGKCPSGQNKDTSPGGLKKCS